MSLEQRIERFLNANAPSVGWGKFLEQERAKGNTRLLIIKKDKDPTRQDPEVVLILRAHEVSKDGVFETLAERLKKVLRQRGFSKVPATWIIEYEASAKKEIFVGASS